MLMWEGDRLSNTCVDKDLAETVELIDTSTKTMEDWFGDSITPSNVTCLDEGSKALHHGRWEISSNRREINLDMMSCGSIHK